MDDALAVGVVESLADLGDEVRDLVPGEPVLVGQERLEVAPLDVLHGDEGRPALRVLADVVDRDDVGVRQDPGGLGLAHEALPELTGLGVVLVALGGLDRLDRDEPADDGVLGEVHHPHRALAELVQDLVAAEPAHARSRYFLRHRLGTSPSPPGGRPAVMQVDAGPPKF